MRKKTHVFWNRDTNMAPKAIYCFDNLVSFRTWKDEVHLIQHPHIIVALN